MPVQSNKGIDASLPGGALRLDVNPSEDAGDAVITRRGPSPNVIPTISGAFAMPQYGAEAIMYARNAIGSAAVLPATKFAAIPFTNIERDYSQLTNQQQCNATDGTFTALHDGFWEVGVQMMFTLSAGANTHVELAIWMDGVGGPALPLAGVAGTPFGTTNPSGPAWSRIAQRSMSLALAPAVTFPSISDAPGHVMTCSTVWCTHAADSVASGGFRYQTTFPPPLRFRFSVRSDQFVTIIGNTALQTRAWMRWLGATGFSGA